MVSFQELGVSPQKLGKFFFDRSVIGGVINLYELSQKGYTLEDNPFSEWLYGDWDETKYRQYLALNSIRPISLYMDYLLDYRRTKEYLDRFGMDYTDIHDPRKLYTTASGSALGGYALNFVSSNVTRLYR